MSMRYPSTSMDFFSSHRPPASSKHNNAAHQSDDGSSDGGDADAPVAGLVSYGIVIRAPADLDSRRKELLDNPDAFQKRIDDVIQKYAEVQIGYEEISTGAVDEHGRRSPNKLQFSIFLYLENKASWLEETKDPSACGLLERLHMDSLVLSSSEKLHLKQAAKEVYESLFNRRLPGGCDSVDLCHVLCL